MDDKELVIRENAAPTSFAEQAEQNDRMMAAVEIQQSKAVQEVQAKLIIAKKFPRDEVSAYSKIMKSCKRITLAEQSIYKLPIGGKVQTGPSIRLAEELIRSWGNSSYGIKEVSRENGKSHCIAFCHDFESNTVVEGEFTVEHWIEVGSKGNKSKRAITDPVEIDRLIANRGARKVRNCILQIIPGDITDAAVKACEQTMAKGGGEPLSDRIRKMVLAFGDHSVTQTMIEERFGYGIDKITGEDLVELQGIFKSLVDKQAKRADFFTTGEIEVDEEKDSVIDKINKMEK